MGFIDDDEVRQVREATDLVQLISETVVLKQRSRLFWGCCPIHNEKTPSLKIDPATQTWHCFGCGKGGDCFSFLMETEQMEFPEAVRFLADRAHIELHETGETGPTRSERERCTLACEAAKTFFHNELMRSKEEGAAAARDYLHSRGFSSQTAAKWQLGYAPGRGRLAAYLNKQGFSRDELISANLAYVNDRKQLNDRFFNRLMFPVADLQGKTIAFGGRVIGSGEPKYLNTSETPIFHKSSNLFGIDKAKPQIVSSATAIVVEGYTDVIALADAGVENVVATLGTALTSQHVKLLSRFARRIVYLFDGDAAGQKAADRAGEFIDWSSAVESSRNPIELLVAVLPDGLDPADFVGERGAEPLREIIDGAQPLLEFAIMRCLDRYDVRNSSQKVRAMEEALRIILPLRGSVTATDYVNLIADALGLEYTAVSQAFNELKAPAAARRISQEQAAQDAPTESRTPDSTAAKIIDADRKALQAEHELLAYVVHDATLLDELDRDLACISWSDEATSRMAGALLAVEHDATPQEVMDALRTSYDDAAQILSETTVEEEDHDALLKRAQILVRSFHKRDLEQRIARQQARLQSGGLSAEEFDKTFAEVSTMQKDLLELQRTGHMTMHEQDGQVEG